METARVKQKEETNTRIIVKGSMTYGRKNRGRHTWEKSQTKPNLTIELLEGVYRLIIIKIVIT